MKQEPRRIDKPEAGYFEIKMIRDGIGAAARLWRPCHCTINGPAVHDWQDSCDRYPAMIATVLGHDKERSSAVWYVWLGGDRITKKRYDYLLADFIWCDKYRRSDPRAKPWRAIDINRSQPAI